jgi:hypothetical protein
LEPRSITVMEKATYHSISARKTAEWHKVMRLVTDTNTFFDNLATNAKKYCIVDKLSPYHSNLNPTEFIRTQVQGYVKKHIKTLKVHVVCKVGHVALSVTVKNRCNHCCCGKAISIKYLSVCLVCIRESFLYRIILSSVACLALPIFSHYLINGMIFGKKVIEHKMCVLIFSTTFVWNTSHTKKNSVSCYKCT